MKTFIIVSSVLASCFASATPVAANAASSKPRISKAELIKRINEKNGGFIEKPSSKTGKVYFINAQNRVVLDDFTNVIKVLNKALHTKMQMKIGESVTPKTASQALKSFGAAAGVFVVDCKECDLPSLVAPEAGWAIVNVAALASDGAEIQFITARTKKQIIRSFAALFGVTCSNYDCNLLLPYKSPNELDKIVNDSLPMDVISHVRKYFDAINVESYAMATYSAACREGWAPAPTNEFQKAIWDKVHAIPDKPLKIKFDPAAQKGKVTK